MINAREIYCPRCFGSNISIQYTFESHCWSCHDCGHEWDWTFSEELMDWPWEEKTGSLPNAGCPWCGTRHIKVSTDGSFWLCRRWSCRKSWLGTYTAWTDADGKPVRFRWKIRVPVRDVPFTWLDPSGAPIARWTSGNPRDNVHS